MKRYVTIYGVKIVICKYSLLRAPVLVVGEIYGERGIKWQDCRVLRL
jgi:hypothetical protein